MRVLITMDDDLFGPANYVRISHDPLAFACLDDEARSTGTVYRLEAPRCFPRGRLDVPGNMNHRFFRFSRKHCLRAKKCSQENHSRSEERRVGKECRSRWGAEQ